MLFAYTINLESAPGTLSNLQAAVDDLNTALLPEGYGLTPLWHAVASVGPTASALRGYEPNAERGHMIALIHALRQLSQQFPTLEISISGGHGLPPTQLNDGEFVMFASAYETALRTHTGWATPAERVMRIPS